MPRDVKRNPREQQFRRTGFGISWGDWVWRVAGLKLPGAADPRLGKYMDDGGGSTGVYGWHFDTGEVAVLLAEQLPHDYLEGSDLSPHVHFKFVEAPVDGQTVIWTVEYEIGPAAGAGPSSTTTATGTYTIDTATDAQWDNVLLDLLPVIDGTSITVSAVGSVTLTRTGDYTGEVLLMSFDAHYQIDSIGSDLEHTKTY